MGSPSVTTSSTGWALGCLRKNRLASSRPWWRLVPLAQRGVERGELLDLHHLRVPAEADQLEVVAAEARADQLVQRQRGALHRHPAPVHRHRERRVDQQRDGGLGAGLGLDDLDVVDLQPHRRPPPSRQHRVGDRARDVPRLGVAELPAPAWRRTARRPARSYRVSRAPERPLIRSATSRSSALPSWRIALGESRSSPSEPRLR